MKENSYNPKFIDPSSIEIPVGFEPLILRMAENIHDQWAAYQFLEDWHYSPQFSETFKVDPNLVPFDELDDAPRDVYIGRARQYVQQWLLVGAPIESFLKLHI